VVVVVLLIALSDSKPGVRGVRRGGVVNSSDDRAPLHTEQCDPLPAFSKVHAPHDHVIPSNQSNTDKDRD
jgi:hypothetical protein